MTLRTEDPTEAQAMIAEIDRVASGISELYEYLPPKARASALELGHSMSNLRRRLVPRVRDFEPVIPSRARK